MGRNEMPLETAFWLVFHNLLSLPQHRGSLPTHGSLILLYTNFHCENCQFALTAFMLARCRRVQECLHAADVKSALRAIQQANLMKNFHWAYNMHLVHLKESEACDMEAAQFKVIASSTLCSYLLNLWRSIFRVSIPALTWFQCNLWGGFGKPFQLLHIFHYAFILHIQNCVYEKKHYNQFLTKKISHHFHLGHYREDSLASANFGQETVDSGASKNPLF